jgi:glycerol-3-phosphate dehydrogenase
MKRSTSLERVHSAQQAFDIVIIGGGASGLGAAVDAAVRGYRVALFEQSDFAKGTSSRSTKLVHGGVRYLQQGNVSLVLEALQERGHLARNAPHLVHSQAFVIPNYSWWEGPFYTIGMKLYDQLAGKLGLQASRHLNRQATMDAIPTLQSEHLLGGVLYYDGQFDDARLAINLAQTAEQHGAAVLNYCRCVGLVKQNGKLRGVEIHDLEQDTQFTVYAKAVINATGVFVDDLRRADEPMAAPIVAASQGVHIVLPKHFLPGEAAMMVPKTADGRVLFAVPWHDHVVLGTTDTPVRSKSLEPRALQAERDFLITHARQYLTSPPGDSDVLSVFAGLRPLVQAGTVSNTAALSREHSILISKSGLITLTGGKWTTYRQMAEDVVDQAERLIGIEHRHCSTKTLPLYASTQSTPYLASLKVYGADAKEIQTIIDARPSLGEKIHQALPYLKAEIVWHAREEMARTVEDVLARRTRALLLNATASIQAAATVANLLASELGHDEDWIRQQVVTYRELAKGYVFTESSSIGSQLLAST